MKIIYQYILFIIYPTFNQHNELIVLKTMSSPVINFLITYTRFESHGQYLNPCIHIEHDILFHGYNTHLQIYKMFDIKKERNLIIHNDFKMYPSSKY